MEEKNMNEVDGGGGGLGSERKKEYLLPASILIAGVMISGSLIYLVHGGKAGTPASGMAAVAANPEAQLAVTDRDVILGDPKAPVTIIEYGDYQCPFCGQKFFAETEPVIRDQYVTTGKVRMVYRNFAFLGPESTAAAEAGECAKDQKKFWAFHDAVYKAEVADGSENNGNLTTDLFLKLAKSIGMDTTTFSSCITSNKYLSTVAKEIDDGRVAGVNSTPTFFINGTKVQGALPFNDGPGYTGFKTSIENALKSQ